MKTSLRKLVATVGGLAIAAMLPVSMMASAAGDTKLSLSVDKEYAKAGEDVKVSINVSGVPDAGWNVLDFELGYNADQLELAKGAKAYSFGAALNTLSHKTEVNTSLNPVLGAIIDSSDPTNPDEEGFGQTEDGTVLTFNFKVKEGVKDGDKIQVSLKLKQFATAKIVDGKAQDPTVLVAAGDFGAELIAGTKPVDPTKPSTDPTKPSTDPTNVTDPTDATDPTDTTDTTDTTSSTDDVVVTDPTTGSNGGAATGESTTLFVVALVLMAGSAIALVGMKKKVFSK